MTRISAVGDILQASAEEALLEDAVLERHLLAHQQQPNQQLRQLLKWRQRPKRLLIPVPDLAAWSTTRTRNSPEWMVFLKRIRSEFVQSSSRFWTLWMSSQRTAMLPFTSLHLSESAEKLFQERLLLHLKPVIILLVMRSTSILGFRMETTVTQLVWARKIINTPSALQIRQLKVYCLYFQSYDIIISIPFQKRFHKLKNAEGQVYGLRWGQSFDDPVHIDDNYFHRDNALWTALFNEVQGTCGWNWQLSCP